jgi:Ca-activated chloride channel family protein
VRTTRAATVAVASLALSALFPPAALAQAGRAQVQEGNRLYDGGRYQEAHQQYLEGLAAAPESPVILFNDGNALYRSEDYQRAMDAYREAIESGDPELASAAWYNMGNALYRQQQLEPSLEAYKQALRLSPGAVDAKHNLERVLQELQQQQQQQDQQDQQDPQQDQDQQQDQQDPQQDERQQDQQPRDSEQGDRGDQQQDQPNRPQDQQGQGEPERRPGQMTPEEAERLLDAIDEDPQDVERRRAAATGPRPRRPW